MNAGRRQVRNRRGAFTVEFALCSGLFFMILLAGFEFSRFMYARHSVDQAAYEAARIGIVPGQSPAQVIARARQILNATGIRSATVNVQPAAFDGNTETVTVSITAPYADSSWLRPVFLAATNLSATITLDHENQAYLQAQTINIGNNNFEPIDK
jgi:Flp pilus assembly protein TadG